MDILSHESHALKGIQTVLNILDSSETLEHSGNDTYYTSLNIPNNSWTLLERIEHSWELPRILNTTWTVLSILEHVWSVLDILKTY